MGGGTTKAMRSAMLGATQPAYFTTPQRLGGGYRSITKVCSELAERGAPVHKHGCVAMIRVRGIMNTGPGAARMVGPRAATLYQCELNSESNRLMEGVRCLRYDQH